MYENIEEKTNTLLPNFFLGTDIRNIRICDQFILRWPLDAPWLSIKWNQLSLQHIMEWRSRLHLQTV